MTNQAASKSTSISTSISISIKYTRKQSDSNKKKIHIHKHRNRVRHTVRQTGRQRTWEKESQYQIESYEKNNKKKYSLISLCLTHIYCYSFILHAIFVCLQYAICWYISLRSTPQIHSRAVSAFLTHTLSFSFYHSFQSKFSFLILQNCMYGKSNEKKTEYVEHFIISNTFSRHFVRKKNHNNNEFARHIRILMKHCFSSKCVPIIMHFHCISKSIPLFYILHVFLPFSIHLHTRLYTNTEIWWYFERFSSVSICFYFTYAWYRWKFHCAFYGRLNK